MRIALASTPEIAAMHEWFQDGGLRDRQKDLEGTMFAGLALIVRPSPGGLLSNGVTDAILARIGNVPLGFIIALGLVPQHLWVSYRRRVAAPKTADRGAPKPAPAT